MFRRTLGIMIFLLTVVGIGTHTVQAEDDKLPEGKGKDYVASVCAQCHGLEAITGSRRTLDEWRMVVNDMVSNGAPLQEDEMDIVAQYLAKNFGPEKSEKADAKPEKKADATADQSEAKESSQSKINVNKSTAAKLESDLQLSAKDAKLIVEYREKHGDFKTVDDLKKVAGIDAKKIEANKDRLEF